MNHLLVDEFLALNAQQRRAVHFALCEYALAKWNLYANAHNEITYVESVVGTRQEVDKLLPLDAFLSVHRGLDSFNVAQRYREPIAALQDEDLTFPENITFAYYAIYNLFQKYVAQKTIDDWLIVNQALSAAEDRQAWPILLDDVVHMARQK